MCCYRSLPGQGVARRQLLIPDLKAGGYRLSELKEAGCCARDLARGRAKRLREAGFPPTSSARMASVRASCGWRELAARSSSLSYSCEELERVAPQAAQGGSFSVDVLRGTGLSADQMQDVGFTVAQLRAGGYTPSEVTSASFSSEELRLGGYSAEQLSAAGLSVKELKTAGFALKDLQAIGCAAWKLRDAGYSL